MQNGSAREMHGWWVMNFIESDNDKPDTFYLCRFIEQRNANSFEKMLVVFDELINKKISIGVVAIYDCKTDTFLIVSDGDRSMYIGIDVVTKNKIDYLSSISNSWSDEYSFRGWMVCDMQWNIKKRNFEYLNKYVEKYKSTKPARQSTLESEYEWYRSSHEYSNVNDTPPTSSSASKPHGAGGAHSRDWGGTWSTNPPFAKKWETFDEKGTQIPKKEIIKDEKSFQDYIDEIKKANGGTKIYNDDIPLFLDNVFWSLDELYNKFYNLYRHAIERMWSDDEASVHVQVQIATRMGSVQSTYLDEAERLGKVWLDGFFDKGCEKYIQDENKIQEFLAEKEYEFDGVIEWLI